MAGIRIEGLSKRYGATAAVKNLHLEDVATGADDLEAATDYIARTRGALAVLLYGISSGALRAALFAQRRPERVRRPTLDAFVWTGRGSPTLEERRKKLPEYRARNRRPADRAFVRSVFTRDHPGRADDATVEAFAEAILALDDSVPTGTCVDMCANLPLVDPERITVPTIIMHILHVFFSQPEPVYRG